MRHFLILSLILLGVQSSLSHAHLTTAKVRALTRYRKECDDSGRGKACYDYGRALWSTPGAIDHKKAIKYLLRGCQLKYQPACEAADDHSTSNRKSTRNKYLSDGYGTSGPCFTSNDLNLVTMIPNNISATSTHGQRLTAIQKNSFWARLGVKENDIIVRVNNMPFNNDEEVREAFATSGKRYGIEVERSTGTVTLWYSCI